MHSSQSWDSTYSTSQELNFWPICPIWTVLSKTVRFSGKLGQNSNSTTYFELWRLQVYIHTYNLIHTYPYTYITYICIWAAVNIIRVRLGQRKSIAIWGCLIFNHGFVLLRMMEEQIFGRRRKEKEMKERKMKGKGKEKERKLEKGLSVVSLFFEQNGYFKDVARGGAIFASSMYFRSVIFPVKRGQLQGEITSTSIGSSSSSKHGHVESCFQNGKHDISVDSNVTGSLL